LHQLLRTRNGERRSVRKPFRCTPLFAAALPDACSGLFYADALLRFKKKKIKAGKKNETEKRKVIPFRDPVAPLPDTSLHSK